jgi:polyhydroxyalkanoate synthesis regulator phasin
VADVAAEQGVALEDVVEALLAQPREHLEEAVAEGQMTQEEADERLAEVEQRINKALERSGFPMDWGAHPWMRQAGRWGWQARGRADAIASVLGLETEELVAALGEDKSVADVAAEQGVALDEVVEALLVEPREHLEQAVAEGQMTQEEADERLAEMEQRIEASLEQPGAHLGKGPADRMGRAQRAGWQARGQVDVLAEVLGLSDEDLVAAMRDGKSVADVAAEQGVALEDVVEALLAGPREHLEEAVAEGRITQEEADERLAEMEQHINERLQEPIRIPQGQPGMQPCRGNGRRGAAPFGRFNPGD